MSHRFEDQVELTRAAAGALAQAAKTTATPDELAQAADYLEITLEELAIASEELDSRLAELDAVQEATERERLRYERLFRDAPGARVVTDRFGAIREINRAGSTLLGVTGERSRGKPLGVFLGGASRAEFRRRLHGAAAGSASAAAPWEATVRRRGERDRVVLLDVQAGTEGVGEDATYHWTLTPPGPGPRDGTPASDGEEAVSDARRVAVLDRELATKDVVLAAIAHDLHGPLAALSSLADLLDEHGLSEAVGIEQTVGVLRRQTAAALRIVDGLLEVQRAGMQRDAAVEPVEVAAVVAQAFDELEDSGHELVQDGRGEFPVSPMLLQRIIVNLVANAEKLAPRGTTIVVRHWTTTEGLVLAVEDEGPGFEAADGASRVFEPFSRLDRDASLPGWGVGLSIVAELARLHGGSAWAVDRTSGGASVQVLLRYPTAAPNG